MVWRSMHWGGGGLLSALCLLSWLVARNNLVLWNMFANLCIDLFRDVPDGSGPFSETIRREWVNEKSLFSIGELVFFTKADRLPEFENFECFSGAVIWEQVVNWKNFIVFEEVPSGFRLKELSTKVLQTKRPCSSTSALLFVITLCMVLSICSRSLTFATQ